MDDNICVLCGKHIHSRPVYDTSWTADSPRFGPYHQACFFERSKVNDRGEYVWSGGIHGLPYVLVVDDFGICPRGLWIADRLVRLAFRLIRQRARLVGRHDYGVPDD